jgi:hypothetical protein
VGVPGPNPGGPGLTPYSTGAPPSGRMPAGGRATSEPTNIPPTPSASDTTSAMPPKHHHARAHHVASTHQMLHAHGPKSGTDTTAQLNQAELARLQAGAPPMAPQMAPPPPPMQGGNSMGMPGPNTGGPGLTPYAPAPRHGDRVASYVERLTIAARGRGAPLRLRSRSAGMCVVGWPGERPDRRLSWSKPSRLSRLRWRRCRHVPHAHSWGCPGLREGRASEPRGCLRVRRPNFCKRQHCPRLPDPVHAPAAAPHPVLLPCRRL